MSLNCKSFCNRYVADNKVKQWVCSVYVSGVFCIKWWYNITWYGELKDLQFLWVSLLLSLLHSFFQSTLLLHTLIIQPSSSRSWVFQTIFLWKHYNNFIIIIIIIVIFLPLCVCVCVCDFYVFCKLGLSLFCLPSSLSINTHQIFSVS